MTSKEVILDPEKLAEGTDGGSLGLHRQIGTHDGADEDVHDIGEESIDVNIVDAHEGSIDVLLLALDGVDLSDVVEVSQELLVVLGRDELDKVGAQHVLAVLDLRSVMPDLLNTGDDFSGEVRVTKSEGLSGDVVSEELGVDSIDDSGDQRSQETSSPMNGLNIGITEAHKVGDIPETVGKIGLQTFSIDVFAVSRHLFAEFLGPLFVFISWKTHLFGYGFINS